MTTSSPLLHAFENLDVAVAAPAELDRAWLKSAFAFGDQHDLAGAAVDHGAGRNSDHGAFARSGLENHVGVHIDFQPPVGVGHLDANARRARFAFAVRDR